MNGLNNGTSISHSGDCAASPASPCDMAYSQIVGASEEHERLLDELINKLAPALRDPLPPTTGSNGPIVKAVEDDPIASELHGRLVGTAARLRQQNNALREIIRRVTI